MSILNAAAHRRRILFSRGVIIMMVLGLSFVVTSNLVVVRSARGSIHSTVEELPRNHDLALLLGTSRYTVQGSTNLFFKYRIEAAAKLYHSGKVRHIIVSGDNSVKEYNEPRQMLQALLGLGVPEEAITLDFAGFRTLDSVVRCQKVFGQDDFIIVSQKFHVERAMFIARKYGISTVGFAAEDPSHSYSFRTRIREYFAKTKAVIDLYIINKDPKFLGDKEVINL